MGGDAAGDGGSGLPQMDDQEQIQVIQPEGDWWWGGWSFLSVLALVLNFLFLVVIVKNRKNRDLRSLLTAVLITITVLDIVNVLRIVPGIVLNVHKFLEFQLVYLGTVTGSVLPRLDLKMDEFKTELPVEAAHPQVSVLWELGNAALRPTLYFLCHPAVWDGLRGLCCSGKRSYGSVSTKEEEVALAPVMERVSSL